MDRLFSTKRTYNTYYEDDEILALGIPSIDMTTITSYTMRRVEQDEKGRIDKFVSGSKIQDCNSAIDSVMYFNHIMNPFSIDEGDVLFVPNHKDEQYKMRGEPKLPDGSKLSNKNTGKKEKTYAERVEELARRGLGVM